MAEKLRLLLAALINAQEDMEVIAQARNGREAVEQVRREQCGTRTVAAGRQQHLEAAHQVK